MSRLHPEVGEEKGVLLTWQTVIQEILLYYSRQEKITTKAKKETQTLHLSDLSDFFGITTQISQQRLRSTAFEQCTYLLDT